MSLSLNKFSFSKNNMCRCLNQTEEAGVEKPLPGAHPHCSSSEKDACKAVGWNVLWPEMKRL